MVQGMVEVPVDPRGQQGTHTHTHTHTTHTNDLMIPMRWLVERVRKADLVFVLVCVALLILHL